MNAAFANGELINESGSVPKPTNENADNANANTRGGNQNRGQTTARGAGANGNNNGSSVTDALRKKANGTSGRTDLVNDANDAAVKLSRSAADVTKDPFLVNKIDATTTKGLIYTIQLGVFRKPLSPAVFGGMDNIMYERIDNDFVRITAGRLANESDALSERTILVNIGFPDAVVSAYFNGKSISMTEAAQIQRTISGYK